MFSPNLENLMAALRCLPGVGAKSAQRMAFYLLARDRPGGLHLAHALKQCMELMGHCQRCRTFSENTVCAICLNQRRDPNTLCIVESPSDLLAIEQIGFRGVYFVLHGHLSPIDGIGPTEIGIDLLKERLQNETIKEMILATNPTVEGEATAHYIVQLAKKWPMKCSRLAHGVPVGSELEYLDGNTLAHAFAGRITTN